MGDGRWRRSPRARWADPSLAAVQGGQASVHLPREGAREVFGLGLSLHEHRHMLNIRAAAACQVKRRRRRISMHEYRHILIACRLPSKEAAAYLTPHASVSRGCGWMSPLSYFTFWCCRISRKRITMKK